MKHCIIAIVIALLSVPYGASAITLSDSISVTARVGLSLGGTMPMGMPASIRSLETYEIKLFPQIGIDAEYHFDKHWGIMAGLRLESKGMEIEAKVKNYHTSIVRGGETLEGQFTGRNHTKEHQLLLTVPVSASYNIGNVRLMAGPYLAIALHRQFEGYASDGYLRVGDPTGAKVELGTTPTERGSYDFSGNMRRLQYGLNVGADWFFTPKFGVYGNLSWGLCGIHEGSFHTIEQTLYPIYGTLGVTYRIK